MKFFGRLFAFAKKVVKSAFKAIGEFVKSLAQNAAGVILLGGAAVGFTKLATEMPFYLPLPLWVEATMIAPIIGVAGVFILVQLMKLQLSCKEDICI